MIRSATTADATALAGLWRAAGLEFRPEDVPGELADAGISCNVIAGLAHDHLFVDWEAGLRALALLREL